MSFKPYFFNFLKYLENKIEIFEKVIRNNCHLADAFTWDPLKNGEKGGLEGIYLKFSQNIVTVKFKYPPLNQMPMKK